ncbi:hypothetical protein CBM2633_B40146 [Cupriavidus taiwanensis]|nr:hypothetical protein CBM2633_B40146 [Cupriavidus taiwanensis]
MRPIAKLQTYIEVQPSNGMDEPTEQEMKRALEVGLCNVTPCVYSFR